jgi:hypothetical protein
MSKVSPKLDLGNAIRELVESTVRDVLTDTKPGPTFISQKTSLDTCGLPPRVFLELLRRADCPCRVRRVGKLRLVDAREFIAWLRCLDERGRQESQREPADGADAVLAEMGLRPAPSAKGRAA